MGFFNRSLCLLNQNDRSQGTIPSVCFAASSPYYGEPYMNRSLCYGEPCMRLYGPLGKGWKSDVLQIARWAVCLAPISKGSSARGGEGIVSFVSRDRRYFNLIWTFLRGGNFRRSSKRAFRCLRRRRAKRKPNVFYSYAIRGKSFFRPNTNRVRRVPCAN